MTEFAKHSQGTLQFVVPPALALESTFLLIGRKRLFT